jgi:molybdopterin/thiamine biosynthesis adenylyltransferase
LIFPVTFDERQLETLHQAAQHEPRELCAIGQVHAVDGSNRQLVRSLTPVPDRAYLERTRHGVVVDPTYIVDTANEARRQGAGIALAHTHPTNGRASFSHVDLAHEPPLARYLGSRLPERRHLSSVITVDDAITHELCGTEFDTRSVGARLRRYGRRADSASGSAPDRYDRQIRAFGPDGQRLLRSLTVAVVGLGGIGSFVATELAHLGVGRMVLIDHDTVDESNLNRLVGAGSPAIGRDKVAVARSAIRRANPDCKVTISRGDVTDFVVARKLFDADFVLLCTDGHASRAVVNQIAYQFYVPTIDVGVAIHVSDARISAIIGRVQMLAPGLPCLVCTQLLDPQRVRWELQRPDIRERDPYFVGASAPQPAVISFNGTVASAAVTMFLSATTGIPSDARWIHYDAMRGSMRPLTFTPQADCIVCSERGALGRGSSWQIPTRTEAS